MHRLEFSVTVAAPIEEIWKFFTSVEALVELTPPWKQVTIEPNQDLRVIDGALHKIKVKQFGLPIYWHARISNVIPNQEFTDTADKSPFAYWKHIHGFKEVPGGTKISDHIEFQAPFWIFGEVVTRAFIRADIEKMFAYRMQKCTELFGTPSLPS